MRTSRIVLLTVLAAAGVLLAAAALYVYTGGYDVAATAPHGRLSHWLLSAVQKRSVQVRAEKVGNPPSLSAEHVRRGVRDYAEMCVVCHGAPGVERGEYGQGITPTPPDLAEAAPQWSDKELFWIVKHGIKLAGMPAFGPTHSDEQIWALVGFLKQLPETSPEQYRQLVAELEDKEKADSSAAGAGHSHR